MNRRELSTVILQAGLLGISEAFQTGLVEDFVAFLVLVCLPVATWFVVGKGSG